MGTEFLNRDSLGIVDAPLADSEVCGGVKEKIRGVLWELRPNWRDCRGEIDEKILRKESNV